MGTHQRTAKSIKSSKKQQKAAENKGETQKHKKTIKTKSNRKHQKAIEN